MGEAVDNGLADLEEGAAGGGGVNAEAAGDGVVGGGVGQAEEGGSKGELRRGLEGGGEGLEEETEGGFGEVEALDEAGIGVGVRGGEEAVEPGDRGTRRWRREGRRI